MSLKDHVEKVQFPVGALTSLAEAPKDKLVWLAPTFETEAVSSKVIRAVLKEAPRLRHNMLEDHLYPFERPYQWWTYNNNPTKIPFHDGEVGFIFTNYWLAYAHLLRVLERRKVSTGGEE